MSNNEPIIELIKCPICGEEYSRTYPRCPFCEEEEEDPGRRIRKPGHRIADRSKAQSARGGLIIVLIMVLALLSWYLFGDKIIFRDKDPKNPGETEQVEPAVPVSTVEPDPAHRGEEPGGEAAAPSDGQSPEEPSGETQTVEPAPEENVDVSNAKLNRSDFTLSYAGEKFTIKLSGTEATPHWSVDNANVATVGTDGTVTAVANGTTTVHCKVGAKDLTCTVRVRNTGKTAAPASAPTEARETVVSNAPPAQNTTAPSQGTTAPSQGTPAQSTPGTSSGAEGKSSASSSVDPSALSVKTSFGTTLKKDPRTGNPDCTVSMGESITLSIAGTSVPVSGWSSSNTSVVTVTDSGKLTPVSSGTANVTATVGDAKVTCIVRVR